MTFVTLRDVRKSFAQTDVIHGVSMDIADGEFVVLVGPSGHGKSTLLRMIAGLEEISGGEVRIGDRVINSVPAKERDIAMVFQSYALYPHMTVSDNMAFSLKLKGMKRPERDARITRAAEILGLSPMLKRYPRQLSGGQRQRVAMGRAIVLDPQVFLFDEPLSNLDAKLRVEMRTEIKALQHRLKTTTIYVTHDQIEEMTMADKIVVMRDARVEQCDSPLAVDDRSANRFVAAFIGSPSMNFIDGTVARRDGLAWFVAPDGTHLPLPETDLPDGATVAYGFRPEHLALGGEDALPAQIRQVEPTGAETMALLTFCGSPVTGVFRDRIAEGEGQSIAIRPDPGRVHLFDPATGLRLTAR